MTVLRCWAFADGPNEWNALQPRPGEFDERVFCALDWVLAEAGRRGLRLLLNLTNYWQPYGGMGQYVAWARQQGEECTSAPASAPEAEGGQHGASAADTFYENEVAQRMYRTFLAALVQRVNTLTGVAYRDDPTILAWGLANEPRCRGDAACCVIPRWAEATAAIVKGLDPNHLVTLDTEGFLGRSTPGSCSHNPFDCSSEGCDFAADCGGAHIDFACCHLYPDLWLPSSAGEEERLEFALRWLDCHVALSRQLQKPLVLSEFGKKAGPGASRATYFRQVLAGALGHMKEGAPLAGTIVWMLAVQGYPDYDGFTLYLRQPSSSEDAATVAALREHAAQVAALNAGAVPPGPDRGSGVCAVAPAHPSLLKRLFRALK